MPRRGNRKQDNTKAIFCVTALVFAFLYFPSTVDTINGISGLAELFGILTIGFALYIWGTNSLAGREILKTFKYPVSPFPAPRTTMNEIDSMTGIEFEKYIGEVFSVGGYKVEYTKASTDYGVDLVVEKDRIRTAVQTKRSSKPLTQEPVREVIAGMLHYKCSKSMEVTNSTFTKSALHSAQVNYVKLIDRDALVKLLI